MDGPRRRRLRLMQGVGLRDVIPFTGLNPCAVRKEDLQRLDDEPCAGLADVMLTASRPCTESWAYSGRSGRGRKRISDVVSESAPRGDTDGLIAMHCEVS